jgi:energy-coupling factor transporter ATP-binding protein EcfA2
MSQARVRIRRIEFTNFKSFSRYSLTLGEINTLVGPNNSGKSTIIGALRTLDAALRFARSRPPARVFVDEESMVGYRIPEESVPISLENVQTDYNGADSRVEFHISNGNSIELVFPSSGGCVLVPRLDSGAVTSAAIFKREFPISLIVVPVLGPVEHNEQRRERPTLMSALSTHRASRHFRSYWYYNPEGFGDFADLVAKTWPGMSIVAPEYDYATGELTMFCLEGRMTRELYWVGFGFQIWCQLLTHLSRAEENSLVIIDEPEVYLNPDVQRQLLGIVRDIGADVLFATHSSEIIAESDPTEIVIIDKKRRTGERLKNIAGIQKALEAVGSVQNMTLTALAKSRRVLFTEGLDDLRIIRRLARRMGMQELSSGIGLTTLASGGFGSWQRITVLASGIAEALGASLMIGAIYDKDYYCDENISEVIETLNSNLSLAHVLKRKEIENYLLIPVALERAVVKAINSRDEGNSDKKSKKIDVALMLSEITDIIKSDVLINRMAGRQKYMQPKGHDTAQTNKEVMKQFEMLWAELETRMEIVPGKQVLGLLRQRVQEKYGITLTDARIVESINRDEIPGDMKELLAELEKFRTLQH